jgi:type I restriction enzyme S subunit
LAVEGNLVQSARTTRFDWKSETVGTVCLQITDGEHATPQRTTQGVPLATAKNIRDGYLDMRSTDWVAKETAEKCWKRCKPRHEDLLMVCVGATTGRICRAQHPPDMVLVRSVALIRPNPEIVLPIYMDLFLRSPAGQSQIWANVKQSAQPCLYLGKMSEIQISFPPLAEQRRIVAKVDRLMALVDRLETQIAAARAAAVNLMEAVVAELTAQE